MSEERRPMNKETKRKISGALTKYYAENPVSEETRQKLGRIWSGRTHTEKSKQLVSESLTGFRHTEETRKRMSELALLRFSDPNERQKLCNAHVGMTGKAHSEETKREMSESQLRRFADPEERRKITHLHTEEAKKRMSETKLGHEVSQETRELIAQALIGHARSKESRKMQSETMIEKWKDPEYQQEWAEGMNSKPNEPELQLQSVLDTHFPGEWKYVGDGQFRLGGKNPDFMNVNSKKQVIEIFGVYWHDSDYFPNRPTEEELIAHYEEYGFDCLVFWEFDVYNEEEAVERVRTYFHEVK